MLPYLSRCPPAFAFIVHFRDDADIDNLPTAAFLRRYSRSDDEFREKACSLPPVVAGEITFGFRPTRGELLVIPRRPDILLSRPGPGLIRSAVAVAAARGVRVVGLGALTAPITAGGRRLVRDAAPGLVITNGNAYTANVVAQNVTEILTQASLAGDRVAIVGCTGSVGGPVTRLLSDAGVALILAGRTVQRVRACFGSLADKHQVTCGVAGLADAAVVVLLTNASDAIVHPADLRPGAVVLDCAQPTNIADARRAAFSRRGILVCGGGLVSIPGYDCSVSLQLPQGLTFACLAETYLFAREGIYAHSVGTPSAEFARELGAVARRHGVEVASVLDDNQPRVPQAVGTAAGSWH